MFGNVNESSPPPSGVSGTSLLPESSGEVDKQERQLVSLLSKMNNQQQSEHSSPVCQTSQTGVGGDNTTATDSRSGFSMTSLSSSFDDVYHADASNRFDTISCCGSVIGMRPGIRKSYNEHDADCDRRLPPSRGTRLLTYAQTISNNIETFATSPTNSSRQTLVSCVVENADEKLYCQVCLRNCIDFGCNLTTGQAEDDEEVSVKKLHCNRRRRASGDCIETAPHGTHLIGVRAGRLPMRPSKRPLHQQWQQLCQGSSNQSKDEIPAIATNLPFVFGARKLVCPTDVERKATKISHESSLATRERATDTGVCLFPTSVELVDGIVRVGVQDDQARVVSRPVGVIINDCGQSKPRVTVFNDQTHKCVVGNCEITSPAGITRACSPLRLLVARIKTLATTLVIPIRELYQEYIQSDRLNAKLENNPCKPRKDCIAHRTTREEAEQRQETACVSFNDNSHLIETKKPNRSSLLTFVFLERNEVLNLANVGSIEDRSDTDPRTGQNGENSESDKQVEIESDPEHRHHLSHYPVNDGAQTIVQSTLSKTAKHSQVVVMTDMASGNEVSIKLKEQQQTIKMTSNASLVGNTNATQQAEQEQVGTCNRTPSQQQIKQKHFSSSRSNERRSTHCSSSGAMTATDLNCDSSISSGGLNYCNDSLLHHYQHQHNNHHHHHHHQSPQQVIIHRREGEEEIMDVNERCVGIRGQLSCPSASSSSASMEQARVTLSAIKPSDQCRITLGQNNQKQSKHANNKPIKKRDIWDKNIEFLLAVIGFAVDLGNIWRFPYICYKNGGGAFLIPYTILFILGGLPIFYLEMSLGQYFSSGCLTVWRRVCPMAKGIGYAMCVLNFFTGLYYNTIISWAVFFFVESFTLGSLPWTSCNNSWNSPGCRTIEQREEMVPGDVNMSTFSSPTRDYFEREVLRIHQSTGIDDLGSIRTPLAIYLAIVFVCIYFAIWKGVKSTGKAVWITALLPYFVLIPLLVRGIFLEGSSIGIKYYLYPNWWMLLDVNVWIDAAKQIYFSLGPGFGTLMALSSYNRFNHNCRRDALIAAAVNYFASFIAGLVIFAVLGYMATIGRISIDKVATEGPGLVFQVYPEGLATMRFSAVWSVLFFMMVITLGIDSTFGGLESVITGLCDEYPRVLRAHRGIFIGLLIIIIYVCSLPTTTYGGNHVIGLLESYGTSVSLLFIVTIETIIVCWIYGADKFCNNLKEMYGEMPGAYWRICWKYISPTLLILIFVAACLQELDKYRELRIEDYTYPGWAPTVGLLMTGSSVCCVPIYAIYYIKTKTSGSFYERLKSGSTPKEHDESDEKDRNDTHLDTDI